MQRQSLIVVGVVLTIAIGYPLCAFFPQVRAISQVRAEIRQKQEFIGQTEKLRSVIAQQDGALESTRDYIEREKAKLATPRQLSSLYRAISNLAKESGARPAKFEPQQPIAYDTFRKVPIKCEFVGTQQAIQSLIAGIEQFPNTVWVEGLALHAGRENGQSVKCGLDLAIFVDNSGNSD
jgi:Tfp pilus assembly protein PilO